MATLSPAAPSSPLQELRSPHTGTCLQLLEELVL